MECLLHQALMATAPQTWHTLLLVLEEVPESDQSVMETCLQKFCLKKMINTSRCILLLSNELNGCTFLVIIPLLGYNPVYPKLDEILMAKI